MFRLTSEPLALSEASLLVFRPAMNAPVLNVKSLPVGPARAAIVVFGEEYGGIGLAIGVRSNEGGQVVVFRNQAPIEADVPIEDALEIALTAAERMGFLFDEDMLAADSGGQGRSQAMALWGRLMGDLELPTAPIAVPSQPATSESILDPLPGRKQIELVAAVEGPELVLDDVANDEVASNEPEAEDLTIISLDLEAGVEAEDGDLIRTPPAALAATEAPRVEAPPVQATPAPKAPEATDKIDPARDRESKPVSEPSPSRTQAMPPQPQLSRFRNTKSDPSEPAEVGPDSGNKKGGPSELGRIPLVRIRRGGPKRVSYLARLLSSF